MREFFVEFAAIVALVLVIVALQRFFGYYLRKKIDNE